MKENKNNVSIVGFKPEHALRVSHIIRKVEKMVLVHYYSAEIVHQFYIFNSKKEVLKKSKNRKLYVAVKNKKIVGVIGVKNNEVKTFYVDPSYHGQGIGRKLFEHVEKIIIRKGFDNGIVHSSLYAVQIYKKFGFKRIKKERKYIGGHVYYDILMRKNYETTV